MQKADIAKQIHQQAGISEKEAATLLECVLGLLKTTLQKGEPISISDFGKFTVRRKLPRQGRNPRTGEAVIISARKVVSFRASSRLKAEVRFVPREVHSRSAD